MDDDDITKKFPILLEGILHIRKGQPLRGKVPNHKNLPCQCSSQGPVLRQNGETFLQSRRQFWPTLTTRHASLVPVSAEVLIPPSRACSCRCMLVASSASTSSALSPLPCGVLKRSFCLPSAAVALLPCACRSSFARVCRPSSAQSVSSCIPVLDWRHHLCLSILFWDGRCQSR